MYNKHTFNSVSKDIDKLGYTLVELEHYKNYVKIVCFDNDGYYYYTLLDNLQKYKSVSKFHKSNPYTIQNINLWLKLDNKPFELLSYEFIGATKNLQFKCLKEDCGEIFNMSWNNISNGFKNKGCPYCAGKKVGLSNCLATKSPELVLEWCFIKNENLTPWNVTNKSGKYVWWKCKECGNEWNTMISNRTYVHSGCPVCNESKGEKKIKEIMQLKEISYIPQMKFDGLTGVGGGLLSYDFFLPQYNILIEYQGNFHDGKAKGQSKEAFKKQQEHDKRKKEYALINKYNFLEIWYWDFDKIEKILQKELFEEVVNIA